MNTSKYVATTFAALAVSVAFLPVPMLAKPLQATAAPASAKTATGANPLPYVHRGTSAKGEFTRALSLFQDGRALLVSIETDTQPATVQNGTWKRSSRADRLSVSLTRQNGKPYRETILLIGSPASGGTLSAIGTSAVQYGAYGLTFAPRIANQVAISYDNKKDRATITATGVNPTTLDQVSHAQITGDGYDVIYWKTGGGGGFEAEGQSLYYFNTLTGRSRRIAAFPQPITKVSETRLTSGRPVLIVSYQSGETGVTGVAVVDPLRERTVKQWSATYLTGIKPGKVTVATYRREDVASRKAKPISTQTVLLDRFF